MTLGEAVLRGFKADDRDSVPEPCEDVLNQSAGPTPRIQHAIPAPDAQFLYEMHSCFELTGADPIVSLGQFRRIEPGTLFDYAFHIPVIPLW